MLIENDNHFHTLYLVVRLSALYKKTWILIRLRHSYILYIRVLPMYICSVIPTCVENLWKTLQDLWKTLWSVWKQMDVAYITPTCKIIISL